MTKVTSILGFLINKKLKAQESFEMKGKKIMLTILLIVLMIAVSAFGASIDGLFDQMLFFKIFLLSMFYFVVALMFLTLVTAIVMYSLKVRPMMMNLVELNTYIPSTPLLHKRRNRNGKQQLIKCIG